MVKIRSKESWFIYILKCGDGSLYTGSTNDLEARVKKHSSGKGAKYTRSHLPVTLVYSEKSANRSSATKREAEIKKLSRKEKLFLIKKSLIKGLFKEKTMKKKVNCKAKEATLGYKRHQNTPASYLVLFRDKKVLLLRRFNTGYEDGNYSLIAGHVDQGENFTQCIIREAKEEAGILLNPEDLEVAHVMHRNSEIIGNKERIDVFFITKKWQGEVENKEPHKCDDLAWFDLDKLPENIIPYVKQAISRVKNKIYYSEVGW